MAVFREQLAGGRIKGGILRARLDWLTIHHGEEAVAEVASRLDEPFTESLSRLVLATNWYPFELLVTVDRAIADLVGGKPEPTWLELGRHSAQLNLTTTYKAFTKGAPHSFFAREASFHEQFLDFGKARYEQTGENSGLIVRYEYHCYSRVFCLSARGYYERALVLHSADAPTVAETACICAGESSCIFEMQW
jgi:hypothetical protein